MKRDSNGVGSELELDLVVSGLTELAQGVLGIDLRSPIGADLPAWTPGAHIDLHLPGGLVRQYSLCGDPSDRTVWTVGVLREPASRGGSEWVHRSLRVGDTLTVRGPRNNFPLVAAQRLLFIAGGIGVTPLLPMIAAADAGGSDWRLLYGGRNLATMAFRDRLGGYGDRVQMRPEDEFGLLDLDGFVGDAEQGTAVYCCGPEKLLIAVEEQCARWPAGSLHVERFHPRDGALDGEATAFEVMLERTGVTVRVESDETIVDAIAKVGVEVPTSCREGTCGTCETAVLNGIPDHRDSFLTEDEKEDNETIMVCCSRALSGSLTLDL
ncbi:PDR/VanB family oxidoreductase [Nocardia sp. NPDC059246]|uniref:PDR/VanB family oxidoreductase n=1 Tax=unclassified Nocardia TaxID=2637762 RepID=UPI0036AF1C36